LETVRPFIDAKIGNWPCSVQIPMLAYLLKVSPAEAEKHLRQTLSARYPQPRCGEGQLLSDLGFLQASPVLERLALEMIDKGVGPNSDDATEYLTRYASAAAKPLVWGRLAVWRKKFSESGAEQRLAGGEINFEESRLRSLFQGLLRAYTEAEGWVLSQEDVVRLSALIGPDKVREGSCHFNCGAAIAYGDSPQYYPRAPPDPQDFERRPSPMEFLSPTERLRYAINQYRCGGIKDLEKKILEFPAGSTFHAGRNFTAADAEEMRQIVRFLRTHSYGVGAGWSMPPNLGSGK